MLDLLQAQKDLFGVLASSAQLASYNVVLQRKEQLVSETYVATALTTPRNGCAGQCVIVEMPESTCEEQNVPGPIMDWVFPVWVLESPQLSAALAQPGLPAKGTGGSCEATMQMIFDEVHHYADDRLSTFVPAPQSHVAAPLGTVALGYRLRFQLKKAKNVQTQRTGQVTVVLGAGTADFVCAADMGAAIWYTLDGSFPYNFTGPTSSGEASTAQLYTGASVATAPGTGQVVRARAYGAGKLGSATAYAPVDSTPATALPISIYGGTIVVNYNSVGMPSWRMVDSLTGLAKYLYIKGGVATTSDDPP